MINLESKRWNCFRISVTTELYSGRTYSPLRKTSAKAPSLTVLRCCVEMMSQALTNNMQRCFHLETIPWVTSLCVLTSGNCNVIAFGLYIYGKCCPRRISYLLSLRFHCCIIPGYCGEQLPSCRYCCVDHSCSLMNRLFFLFNHIFMKILLK
jgi:hypothetical protein